MARRSGRKLVLAGIIQDEKYFREAVAPSIDGDQVRYVGSVGPAERDALLGGAFALLHLVSFEEPFGLSVVEAMATGTPVIAFPRGSMPEIIVDGATGFLVESVEAAEEALRRVSGIDRAACRADVESRFSAERMVSDYIRVYREVV